ncbi:MAG: hypothetical protein DHS20C21_07060 [Gemmatimonadota bacterium]|nr:MAG: hypothetical protein DHS20C21_07060 [Gemmatimonadota bacterium]
MNLSDIDLNALSHALDDSDPDREYFLNLEDASLWTFVFSEATDETRNRHAEVLSTPGVWRAVPSRTTQETYEEIEDFVESLPEDRVQDGLFRALERRGAFKNFREALMEHPEVRQQWLSASKKRSRERLQEFLDVLGWAQPEALVTEVAA